MHTVFAWDPKRQMPNLANASGHMGMYVLTALHTDTILRWNLSVDCVVATHSLILMTLHC